MSHCDNCGSSAPDIKILKYIDGEHWCERCALNKNCPFCGSDPIVFDGGEAMQRNNLQGMVKCSDMDCTASAVWMDADEWNTRAVLRPRRDGSVWKAAEAGTQINVMLWAWRVFEIGTDEEIAPINVYNVTAEGAQLIAKMVADEHNNQQELLTKIEDMQADITSHHLSHKTQREQISKLEEDLHDSAKQEACGPCGRRCQEPSECDEYQRVYNETKAEWEAETN